MGLIVKIFKKKILISSFNFKFASLNYKFFLNNSKKYFNNKKPNFLLQLISN